MSMKAILYEEYGDASKLKVVDHTKPVAQDNEVVVKVRAAGINPVDWKIRAGYLKGVYPQKLPIIPGWDVAGEVESIGAAVTKFKVGDAVYSYNRPAADMEEGKGEQIEDNGCCAQYVTVKEFKLAAKPANLSYDEAAAVPLAGLTAWQGLFDVGKLGAGHTVIILGAAGGVGSFAVQFAKAHGATVIGTCSTKNVDFVKSLGADHVIDYSTEKVAEAAKAISGSIDLAYDCVGGATSADAVAAVKDGGVIVSIANWGIGKLAQEAGKVGIGFGVKPSSAQLAEIAGLIEGGKVKVGQLTLLKLEECRQAHELSESGRTVGKIVLQVE